MNTKIIFEQTMPTVGMGTSFNIRISTPTQLFTAIVVDEHCEDSAASACYSLCKTLQDVGLLGLEVQLLEGKKLPYWMEEDEDEE